MKHRRKPPKTRKLSYTSWQWIYVNSWIAGVNVGLAGADHAGRWRWAYVLTLTALMGFFARVSLHHNSIIDRFDGWTTAKRLQDPERILERVSPKNRSIFITRHKGHQP